MGGTGGGQGGGGRWGGGGGTGSCLEGRAVLSKTLIQLSADGWGCTPSLLVWPEVTQSWSLLASIVGLLVTSKWTYTEMHLPGRLLPLAIYCQPTPLQETLEHSQAGLAPSPVGVTAPFPWVLVCTKFCLCPPRVCFPQSSGNFCNQIPVSFCTFRWTA